VVSDEPAAAEALPEFATRFARWWAAPDPATLDELLAPDVVLVQPMMPTAHGLDAAKASFSRLFEAIPDLHATVHAAAQNGNLVFIDFTLQGTAGGRPIEWRAIDRFTLGDDDLARERVSRFDPFPLVAAGLHPAAWPTMAKLIGARLKR